jgi:hypothetical protein
MPEVEGELEPCVNGYHVVTLEQLPDWLGERIFEVEVGKEILPDDDKSVVRTCRLTRECTGWNERTARLFACDCAEHVLSLYEAKYPDDDRPRKAIEVARRYAEGTATREALAAARAAAWAAAGSVWDAAVEELAVARAAAWDAAWDAAEAAEGAAGAAALAAEGAAGAAALAAVRAAAWDAWAAEQQWQAARLEEILEVEA